MHLILKTTCCYSWTDEDHSRSVYAGEELSVGTSLDNYLSFEARVTGSTSAGFQGTMVLYWPGPPSGGAGSSCNANVTWPMLTSIYILGSGPVNTASVAIMVCILCYCANAVILAQAGRCDLEECMQTLGALKSERI